jgi:hypothetical protein
MWKFGHSNLRDRWIPVALPPPISRLTNSKKHLVCQSLVDCSPRFVALKGGKDPCCFRPEDRTLTTPYSFSSGHVESPLQPCRIAGGIGRSHSLSFDQRPQPETLRTASLLNRPSTIRRAMRRRHGELRGRMVNVATMACGHVPLVVIAFVQTFKVEQKEKK